MDDVDDELNRFRTEITADDIKRILDGETIDTHNDYRWVPFHKKHEIMVDTEDTDIYWLYLFCQEKGENVRYGKLEITFELLECLVRICSTIDMTKYLNPSLLMCLIQMIIMFDSCKDVLKELSIIIDKHLPVIFKEQPEYTKIAHNLGMSREFIEYCNDMSKCPTVDDLFERKSVRKGDTYFGNDNTDSAKGMYHMYQFRYGWDTEYELVEYDIGYDNIITLFEGKTIQNNDHVVCYLNSVSVEGTDKKWIRMILREIDATGDFIETVGDVVDMDVLDILLLDTVLLDPAIIGIEDVIIHGLSRVLSDDRFRLKKAVGNIREVGNKLRHAHYDEIYKMISDLRYPTDIRNELSGILLSRIGSHLSRMRTITEPISRSRSLSRSLSRSYSV